MKMVVTKKDGSIDVIKNVNDYKVNIDPAHSDRKPSILTVRHDEQYINYYKLSKIKNYELKGDNE